MKKEIVEREIAAVVEGWKAANAAAWETVGRPGPVFTLGDLGDWDYIEAVHAAHNSAIEADEASAVEDFWAVLAAAPVWLRLSRPRVKDAWERAFVDARQGVYVGHAAMPFIEDIFDLMP